MLLFQDFIEENSNKILEFSRFSFSFMCYNPVSEGHDVCELDIKIKTINDTKTIDLSKDKLNKSNTYFSSKFALSKIHLIGVRYGNDYEKYSVYNLNNLDLNKAIKEVKKYDLFSVIINQYILNNSYVLVYENEEYYELNIPKRISLRYFSDDVLCDFCNEYADEVPYKIELDLCNKIFEFNMFENIDVNEESDEYGYIEFEQLAVSLEKCLEQIKQQLNSN